MYKKVLNDDGELESMNDKRAACIILQNGLLTMIETIRSKILTLNNLPLLEEMVTFLRNIYFIMSRVVSDYCKETVSVMNMKHWVFYPLIREARQHEIHSLLCDMACMMSNLRKKRYFKSCNKVYVLNHFLRTLNPSLVFLQKFVVRNQHFHVVLPPPEPKRRNYYPKYY